MEKFWVVFLGLLLLISFSIGYTTEHTPEERREEWANIMGLLGSSVIDWEGNETAYLNQWQKQLHLYEVPFYYIEYGMAQLGAIAMEQL